MAGPDAVRRVAAAAVAAIDLRRHSGVHPRLGAVDVVPFVPYGDSTMADAEAARDEFAAWIAGELGVPAFVYREEGPTLPQVRRTARFQLLPHPTAGAVAVGARAPLVAYNVWLREPDLALARRVAVQGLGILCVAAGVALMITAELGVAPYYVVTTGMHETFGLPLGLAAVILPVVLVLLGLTLGAGVGRRGLIGLGTILDVVLVGPVLGLFVDLLPELHALAPRMAAYAVGFAGVALGVVLVVLPDLGAGPAEVVMLVIARRGRPLAPVRTGIELACVAVGWILGGQVGLGTLAFAVLVGPTLRWGLTALGYDPGEAATRSDTAAPGV